MATLPAKEPDFPRLLATPKVNRHVEKPTWVARFPGCTVRVEFPEGIDRDPTITLTPDVFQDSPS